MISAFIKSIRGSDVDAALHYLALMIEAGEDPRFIARRLIVHASEDVGMADPSALPVAVAAAQAVEFVGLPEVRINLAQAVIHLALAPKSNAVIKAISAAADDVRAGRSGPVPAHLRDASYRGAAKLGHGKGYLYPHDFAEGIVRQDYLPRGRRRAPVLRAVRHGAEARYADRVERIRAVLDGSADGDREPGLAIAMVETGAAAASDSASDGRVSPVTATWARRERGPMNAGQLAALIAAAFFAVGVCATVYVLARLARLITAATAMVTSYQAGADDLLQRSAPRSSGRTSSWPDRRPGEASTQVAASMSELSEQVAAVAGTARLIASGPRRAGAAAGRGRPWRPARDGDPPGRPPGRRAPRPMAGRRRSGPCWIGHQPDRARPDRTQPDRALADRARR